MSDCGDLVDAGDNAVIRIDQSVEDELDGLLVGRHRRLVDVVFLARNLMGQNGAGDADSLAETFCLDGFIGSVDELVLKGGAACVDDKDLHFLYLV